MRITLELCWQGGASFFPYSYHEQIQACIYNHLPPKQAKKLHESGFMYEKRKFKLFVFSRLLGKRAKEKVNGGLLFYSPLRLCLSSPVGWILEGTAESMMRLGKIRIGRNELQVASLKIHSPINFSQNGSALAITMLSPMTTYSTYMEGEKRKTYYYTPFEEKFSLLITENLRKKYALIHDKESRGSLHLRPLFSEWHRKQREKILHFKGTVIKGWDGYFEMTGDPELMEVAYYAGLGSKNSQGFGCWDMRG